MTLKRHRGWRRQDERREEALHNALERLGHIERHLCISQPPGVAAHGSKTEATIGLVIERVIAGGDLSEYDDFWVHTARRELARRAAERERVLASAAAALQGKRFHPARAREIALTVLTAASHPAFNAPAGRCGCGRRRSRRLTGPQRERNDTSAQTWKQG